MLIFFMLERIAMRLGIDLIHNKVYQLIFVALIIALCCLCFEAYERIKFKLVGK